MNTLVLYFILANLGLAAFYLFFRLLLQKDTFFAGKRIALLAGIILALTYPLLDLSSWIQRSDSLVTYADVLRTRLPEIPVTKAALANTVALENEVVPAVEALPTNEAAPTLETAASTSTGVLSEPKNNVQTSITSNFTVFDYLLLLYFLTTAFLFFRIARQLLRIQNCRKQSERVCLHDQWVYVLKGCKSPFSFFNAVFMDPDVYSDKNQLEIIEHEKAHIKQGHSYDVVFSELVCALFWFNPFAWLLKRSLRENLEFLADRDVIKKGVDPKTYQYKLLQLSCHRSDANLANHFNVSQLKKRIVMMNKKRTSWKGLGKYALYLPLFAALLLTAYAWGQQHETEAKEMVEKATADSKVVSAITTTIDNAKALAQNTSTQKTAILTQEVFDKELAEREGMNMSDYTGPQTMFRVDGVMYKVIDDKNIEVTISKVSSIVPTNKLAGIEYPTSKGRSIASTIKIVGKEYTTTSIGQSAFSDNVNLSTIDIPSTITLIDNQAFMNCSGLTSITLPASLKKIGSEAFSGCSSLAAINIPASVTSIGDKAFYDCTGLKELTVDENNAQFSSVDGVLFNKRKAWLIAYPYNKATHYTIPSFVKVIGLRAFSDCTGLTSITISSSVTSIMQEAFMGCTGLTSITIPSSVTSIMTGAFNGCTGLTSVTISASVERIEAETFKGCTALTSVTIPATTESISDEAFKGCTALKQIIVDPKNPVYDSFEGKLLRKNNPSRTDKPSTLTFQVKGFNYKTTSENSVELAPNGLYTGDIVIPSTVEYSGKTYEVTSIGASAFSNSPKLTSVSIPASVSKISNGFGNAPESIHITVDEKNPYFIASDDVVFDKNKTILFACKGKKTQYIIPSSVTKIEMNAFMGCKSLASLVIPSSVTTIAPSAFYACIGLTSVEIPASVTLINAGTFQNCIGLTSVVIPTSVTSISVGAFATCTALTSVTIPSSVNKIYANAFKGCTGLMSISLPSSISKIEPGTFQGCTGLTSITIPRSVTSIDSSAFGLCSNLATVTLSENVSNISKDAFTNCSALKQFNVVGQNPNYSSSEGVLFNKDKSTLILFPINNATQYVIPSSVTTIGKNAFRNCKSLTSITIPSSVTTIGDNAFENCTSLNAVVLPSSVKSIGKSAFRACPIGEYRVDAKNPSFSSMDGVLFNKDKTTLIACPVTKTSQYTIPSTVTSLGDNAFYGCSGLTSIVIPSSVKTIGTDAFTNCKGLTSLVIPPSVTSIGSWAFNTCSNLSSVTLPSSVTSIGMQAFFSCFNLKEIHCQMKKPLVLKGLLETVHKSLVTLYVPKGSKELYANAPEWGEFITILEE